MKKENSHVGAKLGLAGLAVAGIAGAYFLYGKNGAKNRKAIKSWTLRAKADVLEQLEKAKELSQDSFNGVVDQISEKYGAKVKGVSAEDVMNFAKDLKKHWKDIKSELTPKSTAKKSAPKKVAKKAAKKK